jgi:hypothetical protein
VAINPQHIFSNIRNFGSWLWDGGRIRANSPNEEEDLGELRRPQQLSYRVVGGTFTIQGDGYDGCKDCYYYSMLFGGSPNKLGKTIKTEEDFEREKEEFVQHFNDSHQDLMRKREGKTNNHKKFKKMPKADPTTINAWGVPLVVSGGLVAEGTITYTVNERNVENPIDLIQSYDRSFVSDDHDTIGEVCIVDSDDEENTTDTTVDGTGILTEQALINARISIQHELLHSTSHLAHGGCDSEDCELCRNND